MPQLNGWYHFTEKRGEKRENRGRSERKKKEERPKVYQIPFSGKGKKNLKETQWGGKRGGTNDIVGINLLPRQ